MVFSFTSFVFLVFTITYGITQTPPSENALLFTAVDNALPDHIMEKLMKECLKVDKYSREQQTFIHDKRTTFWISSIDMTNPRSFIEEAIWSLRGHMQQNMMVDPNEKIIGAEWWVQNKKASEGINFHYDKDESVASLKGKMKHPAISTITYLSDVGAPTLIFNQTTPDGNKEIPTIPERAYISYPRRNRHITFRGDLQHGVLASAAPLASKTSNDRRVTLAVNWWSSQPEPPNCVPMTKQLLNKIRLLKPNKKLEDTLAESTFSIQGEIVDYGKPIWTPSPLRLDELSIPSTASGRSVRHELLLPPGDLYFVDLPVDLDSGVHAIHWAYNQAYGALGKLDLNNMNQVNQLFHYKQPKVMLLYDDNDLDTLVRWIDAVLPITKKYLDDIKVYLCSTATCADVMNVFNVQWSDLPLMVIDDTFRGIKFVQPKSEFSTTSQDIESFWQQTLLSLQTS